MKIGDTAALTRTFSDADMTAWMALAGQPAGAGVPRPLIAALFSKLLGVELPGPGTNYLKQDIEWLAEASLGAVLEARVTITRLRPEKHLVDLETVCRIRGGAEICRGRALVYVEDVGA